MRVLIAGTGVAGSLIAAGLRGLTGVTVETLERVDRDDHVSAGNGLNIGPNAVVAVRAAMPALATELEQHALPWCAWRAADIGGEPWLDLPLADVADADGLRIRWSDLYRVCRQAAGAAVRYRSQALAARAGAGGVEVEVESESGRAMVHTDLLLIADGRFSTLREQFCPPASPRQLGVSNFRVLLDDGHSQDLDDLQQWYNGPNRLLAFRLRDGRVYLSGNLPLAPGEPIPDAMRTADYLASAYLPTDRPAAPIARWLVEESCAKVDELHWSRAQEIDACYRAAGGAVVLVGDAAHAMAPTLGQGATQAIEDACAFVNLFRALHARGPIGVEHLARVFEAMRRPRVEEARRLSWEATDSLLTGADAAALVRLKGGAEWRAGFARLYREAPLPADVDYWLGG